MTGEYQRPVVFPNEFPVDPRENSRAVFVHINQGLFVPDHTLQNPQGGMRESFRIVDGTYTSDRGARFRRMAGELLHSNGLDMALKYDRRDFYGSFSRDLVLVYSPLNDGRPESDPGTITRYVTKGPKGDRGHAKPNSHRPAGKLDIDYEFGHAEGMGIGRLQLFAREAPAMTHAQRKRVSNGDMTPYGELAEKIALPAAERHIQETYGIPDFRFDRLHFVGFGMGAKALGSAVHFAEKTDREVGAIILGNFTMGDQSQANIDFNYMTRRQVGEASELLIPSDYVRVPELSLLDELDQHKAELAMRWRMVKAGYNQRRVHAILNAKEGPGYMLKVMGKGATITWANAINEGMNAQTAHYMPIGDGKIHRTDIVGVDGEQVNMGVNEIGPVVAVITNLGLYNHLSSELAV